MDKTQAPAVLEREITVAAVQTDFLRQWRPSAMLDTLQEAAAEHAQLLSASTYQLMEMGLSWVIIRMQVEILRPISLWERVTVRTWPKGISGPFCLRDYEVIDAAGERVIRATSCWLVVDAERHRPLRPGQVAAHMPENAGLSAIDQMPGKLRIPADALRPAGEHRVCYTDVDVNCHANNVRYLDWMCDAFDLDFFRRHALTGFQINYVKEVLPGQRVALWADTRADGVSLLQGRQGDQVMFEAKLTWQPTAREG